MCAKLRTSMYGTKLAAQNWQQERKFKKRCLSCWRGYVTCQLFCTVHDVSSVDGKKIGSCCQCSMPSGFGKADDLSDQWLFLHAQLSQLSLLHNVV